MTIDEAIEVQEQSLSADQFFLPDDLITAMRLGLEALEWIKRDRARLMPGTANLLPTETKE